MDMESIRNCIHHDFDSLSNAKVLKAWWHRRDSGGLRRRREGRWLSIVLWRLLEASRHAKTWWHESLRRSAISSILCRRPCW